MPEAFRLFMGIAQMLKRDWKKHGPAKKVQVNMPLRGISEKTKS